MKKYFALLLVLAFIFTAAAIPAYAAEKYENVFALFEHWESEGYPDDVSSVYSTDGSVNSLCILLVDRSDERESQIRSQLLDCTGLSFGNAEYSLNEMKKVQDEIANNYMGSDKPVVSCGIGWISVDGEVRGFGESGRESRVTVGVLKESAKEYERLFNELYGDLVYVESTDGYYTMEETTTSIESSAQSLWLFALLACALLALGAAVYFGRVKRTSVMQTMHEDIVTATKKPSLAPVKKAVEKSDFTPKDSVFEKIKSEIEPR